MTANQLLFLAFVILLAVFVVCLMLAAVCVCINDLRRSLEEADRQRRLEQQHEREKRCYVATTSLNQDNKGA